MRSINNKVEQVMDYLEDNNISIHFITETWLTDAHNNITAAIKSHGYKLHHCIRQHHEKSRGGGVGIIYHNSLNLTKVFINHGTSFESVSAKFKDSNGNNTCCSCIYRSEELNDSFFVAFDDFIGDIFLKFSHILICGDLNIHLDNLTSQYTNRLNEITSSYGLYQLVKKPTHKSGHLLDVVICSNNIVNEKSIQVIDSINSTFPKIDHFPVLFNLSEQFTSADNQYKTINFRNIKNIDRVLFATELENGLSSIKFNENCFESVLSQYNTKCSEILDDHAPLIIKKIKDRKCAPWFDGEYKCMRALRRKAEKTWKTSKSNNDQFEKQNHENFCMLRDKCTKLADQKKLAFFQEQFKMHSFSSKSLFKFVDNFLDKGQELILPPSTSIKEIVDKFNSFFHDKINKIRSNFENTPNSNFLCENGYQSEQLTSFIPATEQEISDILNDTEFKLSSVDPIPASLLKENLDMIIPHLCDIVNLSLSSGNIEGAKIAHITPLIKDSSLDNSILNNYRPISNLSFVGKLIERVVLSRLNEHLSRNNLNITHQSGYKKNHSTETLLIRIVNDLLIASSESKATVVMMLDLSAAFDTVDHQKLLKILKTELGIGGTALKWFKSFLIGRCQCIKINDEESYEIVIEFGVPQGSVLGPVLFNIYIRSLYATVKKASFAIQGFADDHQVYRSFAKLDEYSLMVDEVPKCFRHIEQWMTHYYLQLNAGKTEVIVFGTPGLLSQLQIQGVFLSSNTCIRLSPVVKNLGFRLDNTLSMKKQVSHVKKVCFHKLRQIARMRYFLSTKQLTILIQAVITTSLDYCNALYFGCYKTVISQLQLIQNRACRVIFGLKKRESVSDKLKSLHWLKVDERIQFKVLLLVFKCLHGIAPPYISELIPLNNLNSTRQSSYYIPRGSCDRAFSSAAPKLWNQLPYEIKESKTIENFKRSLKTHLFKKCYAIQ